MCFYGFLFWIRPAATRDFKFMDFIYFSIFFRLQWLGAKCFGGATTHSNWWFVLNLLRKGPFSAAVPEKKKGPFSAGVPKQRKKPLIQPYFRKRKNPFLSRSSAGSRQRSEDLFVRRRKGFWLLALRTGIEPVSAVPETAVLSVERSKHAIG